MYNIYISWALLQCPVSPGKHFHKFRFVPFLGHTETDRNGKFVNFSEDEGRKVNRPNNCSSNIYLYGGSTTFGYNVKDSDTIGEFLQNEIGNDFCVYNHGRSYYYSKQESKHPLKSPEC